MIAVAGGILLALFVLLMLFGFALTVRGFFRWMGELYRFFPPFVIGVATIVGLVLLHFTTGLV